MINRRSFMMGVGVGIMIGALLLQLFQIGESGRRSLDDFDRRIEEGSGPSPSSAAGEESAGQAGEPTAPAAAPGDSTPEAAEDEAGADGEPAPAWTETPDDAEPTPSPDGGASAGEARELVVRIEPGTSLGKSAELLAERGIIDSASAFVTEMKRSNKRVRAGYFLFREGIGVEEAVKIVTGQPLNPEEAATLQAELEPDNAGE